MGMFEWSELDKLGDDIDVWLLITPCGSYDCVRR